MEIIWKNKHLRRDAKLRIHNSAIRVISKYTAKNRLYIIETKLNCETKQYFKSEF